MADDQQARLNLSLILSDVLSDIGVNDEMIMRKRNGALLMESLYNVDRVMTDSEVYVHFFGSQSEGTTTIGINSDDDALICNDSFYVIQDWCDWKLNETNLLMVQDETTAPGYCHLQLLCGDVQLTASCVPDNNYCEDRKGRICLKNTKFHHAYNILGIHEQHGPAANRPTDEHGRETDVVNAIRCERWPNEGNPWLYHKSPSGWPSKEIKTESERSGCFLVPVGSKTNGLNEMEWRISTSQAERLLMFSLNITHLRCYVLMKMLLKSHINRGCDNVISSYMCKTAMLHCVERTSNELWCEHNLILCLNQILQELYNCVLVLNCPHFIIPENNLMAERIMPEQQELLLENIQQVINSDGRVLFGINTDDIGERLHSKLELPGNLSSATCIRRRRLSGLIMHNTARCVFGIHVRNTNICNNNDNSQEVIKQLLCYYNRCKQHYSQSSELEEEAYRLLSPLLCTTIGSVLASYDIKLNRSLFDIAMDWFKLGLNSDISSSWLKLATVYYSTGYMDVADTLLRYVEQRYDRNVVKPICTCHSDQTPRAGPGFNTVADQLQTDAIRRWVSYCVMFMRCEGNIVPHEMQQEYNRSTQEEIHYRSVRDNVWMNFAVVDSLPYLYFLQYKTYGRLRNHREQQTALQNLEHVIRDGRNLFHKETALNLLGQCMEQENQLDEAIHCYESSLLVRPNNNAAQFHRTRICHNDNECDIDETILSEECCRNHVCCTIL